MSNIYRDHKNPPSVKSIRFFTNRIESLGISRTTFEGDRAKLMKAKIPKEIIKQTLAANIKFIESLTELAEYIGIGNYLSITSLELDSMISKGASKKQVEEYLAQKLARDLDPYGICVKIRELALRRFEDLEKKHSVDVVRIANAIDDPHHPFNQILTQALDTELRIKERRTELVEQLNNLISVQQTYTDPFQIQEVDWEIAEIYRALQIVDKTEIDTLPEQISLAVYSLFGKKEPLNLRRINQEIVFSSGSKLSIEEQNEIKSSVDLKLKIVERILRQIIPMSNYGLTEKLTVYIDEDNKREFAKLENSMICINPNTSVNIILHELFHIIEYQNPILYQRVRGYYYRRTNKQTEPLRRISDVLGQQSGWNDNEFTRVDNWSHPYIGKEYGYYSTELTSMFSEYLTIPEHMRVNNSSYLRRDPEYVQFMIGVLTDPNSYKVQALWQYES